MTDDELREALRRNPAMRNKVAAQSDLNPMTLYRFVRGTTLHRNNRIRVLEETRKALCRKEA